ncbi:oxaloacetate decarboxylase alpha subunit [Kineothrix alysoides]|uniref:Oxaloacetate decarboxylase alpha subunit n=1 Tax=Kineothrix alysoides TaxID=1469948 RepID=A0A4R1QY41_9FIRM|nr:pyruvate carboxylase subunit B [Kineothrix alysoides]TCL57584.1 oxaloacetate decarboxylase alpha subunit [Kineothrix alysoides]
MELKITETVLRDANQSLIATRMTRNQFEDILPEMDQAGYYSVECWGGAVFDSCIRYLREDPWERLKYIRKKMPNTKLQMLLRGQSLLGYRHYSDDVVRKFVYNSIEKGIDIIRIFDAMNDIRNIEVAVNETIKNGAHASCTICYTVSPVHSIDNYILLARQMENMGADSVCIKDMSGILLPSVAFELIKELKSCIRVPIVLHSHCSTGYAYMTYLKAIEAGVDIVDTAVSSFSGGTSQPATEVICRTATESGRKVSIDIDRVQLINEHFERVMESEIKAGTLLPQTLMTHPRTIKNQIPGGMYSNLLSQLRIQNAEERISEVEDEVIRIRKDLGYPPLVTPISQMIGTQATINVLLGERYKQVIDEVKSYFRGEYGIPPGKVNQDLMYKLANTTGFSSKRLSVTIPPAYEAVKERCKMSEISRSDILTSIMFPALASDFFKDRDNKYFYSICEMQKDDDLIGDDILDKTDGKIMAIILSIIAYKTRSSVEALTINALNEVGR